MSPLELESRPVLTATPAGPSASGHAQAAEIVRLKSQLARMAAVTELMARLETAGEVRAACQVLADQVRDYLGVDQVIVGLCRHGSIECRLTAISGVSTFHPRSERAQAAQAVLQEAVARGELASWPPTDVSRSGALLAHRQFANAVGAEAIISGPLRDASGVLRGVWMVIGEANTLRDGHVTSFLRAAESPVASALNIVARARKGPVQRVLIEAGRRLREKRGLALLATVMLMAVVLCIPCHYHARCDCTVEPVTRRFVAAPFDGPLEKSLVEPGDVVEAGQLLARMDGREVRWELAGTRAELHRAAKQRAGHVASHASGEAEIARFEVDRLQMRTELLEHRDQNLEIRSPIAGVVVSGDLADAEGIPLEIGQTLFEIAPLDEMVVEVAIAEDDFAYVRVGMPVRIRLEAFPLRRFEATIEHVHPRAEIRDDENVFIAEVMPDRPGSGLRPGMRGSARVQADRYPLGWNLLRRPLTAAVAWLGW